MINTIVFDLDGTLLNTLNDLMNSVNYALEKYGFPQKNIDEIRAFAGNGVKRLVCLSTPEGTDDRTTDECLALFKEHYKAHSVDETFPYEGVKEMLDEVRKAGFRTAVVTNKMQEAATGVVKNFFGDTFDVIIGQVDGMAQKPAPDGVLAALKALGSTRETAVYVGDSEVDCQTAHNSGLPIVGVTWGFRDLCVLEENKAEYIISSPEEIVPTIRKIS